MDDRTRAYVRGRFGDYYRGTVSAPEFGDTGGVVDPRAPDDREWAYVVFSGGMVRHKSLLDLGSLDGWLADTKPQHVYYSSARYDRPEASAMSDKGWKGADLIFDLDADHLRDAEPDDTYAEMLAKCKDALLNLLSFVEGDLGFEDTLVVFSGGRGYHIHVYDDRVQSLGSDARREIVDYVKGTGFRAEHAFSSETVAGSDRNEWMHGRKSSTQLQRLRGGAWSERIRDWLVGYANEVASMEDDEAVEHLRGYDNVGEKKADKLLEVFRDRREEIGSGNLDVARGARGFWETLLLRAVEETSAETDEPVTTDTRRLIRLPGSLHGGTGFRVVPLGRGELDGFDPLRDAVVFSNREQTVVADEAVEFEVGGRRFNTEAGEFSVPEYAAIFGMLRGDLRLR
ncbi:DNA primase catalytic subunit PriS [Haladaptatus sp. F3-133]|uniref:DNA primase small subunit PriS n=1 Tax=Halorutilus salinus TaxID=2487751 RepID=A0A9Q4GJ29_9EURY|nr:DNA primase catalytic subunit PriS [Halorutilus salinus]MCX2818826.1 DNA primase catalytic subunit PriS [Halorutilus salinus]